MTLHLSDLPEIYLPNGIGTTFSRPSYKRTVIYIPTGRGAGGGTEGRKDIEGEEETILALFGKRERERLFLSDGWMDRLVCMYVCMNRYMYAD